MKENESSAANLSISCDYNSIFRKRILVISGVGRSGTTILGKLIGSMAEAFYIYEPVLALLMPLLIERSAPEMRPQMTTLMQSVLFEDLFLLMIQGRALNFNTNDDSYFGHYVSNSDVESRWNNLSRRADVIKYLEGRNALFVIKIPEFQKVFNLVEDVFVEPRYLHLIRNGFDVVSSSLKRGWFTDDFMENGFLNWLHTDEEGNAGPWYLDAESRSLFPRWSAPTRAASIWRQLTQCGLEYAQAFPTRCTNLRYEDFIANPDLIIKEIGESLRLKPTQITERHLESVRRFPVSRYEIDLKIIEEPERSRFAALMKLQGYL